MNVDYMKKTPKLLLLILSCGVLYLCKIKMHDNINIKGRVHMFKVLSLCGITNLY